MLKCNQPSNSFTLKESRQGFCFTVCTLPETVTVPWRCNPVPLDCTEYLTVPLPVPLLPDVIVIQGTSFTAVHVQVGSVVTVMSPMPPALLNVLPEGEMESGQAPS